MEILLYSGSFSKNKLIVWCLSD